MHIVALAREAGDVILRELKNKATLGTQHKDDDSPVTNADLKANAIVLNGLAKLTPGIPILSEEDTPEHQAEIMKSGTYWCVDPLDGTRTALSYAEGNRGHVWFGTLIGLVKDGVPVFGVAHYPANENGKGVTYFTNGSGTIAYKQIGEHGEVRSIHCKRQGKPLKIVSGYRGAVPESIAGRPVVNEPGVGGSRIIRTAEGAADLGYMGNDGAISFGFWDLAAPHAILRAAGGDLVTMPGEFANHQQEGALAQSESLHYDGKHHATLMGEGKPYLPGCLAGSKETLRDLGLATRENLLKR